MCLDCSLQKRKAFFIGDVFDGAARSDLPYPSLYEPVLFCGARRPARLFSYLALVQRIFSMKTLVTPQRETEHRTWVPIIPIVQRVMSYSNFFFALQGATTYKEVTIADGKFDFFQR